MEHGHHEHKSENIIPVIILSLLFFFAGFYYKLLFLLAYLIAGSDIIIKSVKNIFGKEFFDENFLMSVATIGALCIHEYPEAVMVMLLYKIGEYLQDKAVEKSIDSVKALMDIRPDYAVVNGQKTDPATVKAGDIITVRTGERIPLDGIVTEGRASIDNSALTGEPVPVTVCEGQEVLSGGINLDGLLTVKVTKEYSESTVNKILELIESAAEKKAKSEKFITKFAKIYTPVVVFMALLIAAVPFLYKTDLSTAVWLERAFTFLIISCPCALVLSVPLTFFAGIGAASANGILIKGGNYLEQISKFKTVVFDKTGTLTTGSFGVLEIRSKDSDLLKYAAVAESASSHPIAAAIKKGYGLEIPVPKEVREYAGKGVEAVFEDKLIRVGTVDFAGAEKIKSTGTVVYVSVNDIFYGYIILSDRVKDDSKQTIDGLNKLGIKSVILTGDNSERTEEIRAKLGITEAFSGLLPSGKVEKLEEILSHTKGTAGFVGDGINDAPVIKRADVGIAMGALGTDAAIEVADAVIMDDKPSKIITAIKISKKTMNIVKQNIVFALFVKMLFLLLGGFGLMTMWGAVFADVGVTLIAVLNSLRAKKI